MNTYPAVFLSGILAKLIFRYFNKDVFGEEGGGFV
jgi:hypothetical protein